MATIIENGQITINGMLNVKVSKLSIDYDSLATEDSGRDDSGNMHIGWILRRTRKVSISLPPTDRATISAVLDAVLGREYTLTYNDAISGAKTINVYTSKGSAELYNGRIRGGLWQGVSFNAIEMTGER